MRFFCSLIMVAVLLTLPACGHWLRRDYQPPSVELPERWQQAEAECGAQLAEQWWQAFGDRRLNELVEQMLARSTSLAGAALRLQQARLRAELAESALLPEPRVQGSGSSNRVYNGGGENRSFSASAGLSYEIDLFGRLARSADAASWEATATAADLAALRLSLTGAVINAYYQLGYLNQQLRLSAESIAYARRTLELVQAQQAAGAAARLEVLEAERNLASQQASHENLLRQRTEERHALAILLDRPPQQPVLEAESLADVQVPQVAAGVPADLLARRPDLQAAEARLRAALARSDASQGSLYPQITLTGSLGGSSDSLSRLLANPVASLGAGLVLPFVQWRDLRRQAAISEADYQQAVLSFRETLYTSLSEVENALAARTHLQAQQEKLAQTLAAAQQGEELYRVRYQAGATALKSWLDAQEKRRQAEIALAQNILAQIVTQVSFAKALGGGSLAAEKLPAH